MYAASPRRWALLFITAGLAVASGCASYQAKPLSSESVERALAPPNLEAANRSAAALAEHWNPPLDFAGGALAPDKAAVLAVVVNPSLRAERDRRNLAQAQVLQAGVLPNPQLSFGLIKPYGANSDGTVAGADLALSWEITSLIGRDARINSAKAASAQVDLEVAWKEWQVAEAAKNATLGLAVLDAELALRKEMEGRQSQNLDLVRTAVERHQVTIGQLAVAEASSQQARAERLAADASVRAQRLALKRALGLPPETDVNLGAQSAVPSRLSLPPRDQLLTGIEARRLDLIALQMGYESQEEKLRAAVLQQFPKINLGLTQTRDIGNFYTVGFNVSIDLPIFDRNQGQIAVETATREQLFDEYVERVFEARADLAKALDAIDTLTERIVAAEAALPNLERIATSYQVGVLQGSVDALTSAEAQNNLAQHRVNILELKRQLGENLVALELATGVYVPVDAAVGTERPGPAGPPPAAPATRELQR